VAATGAVTATRYVSGDDVSVYLDLGLHVISPYLFACGIAA
jgi:hypothetical protein